jgi:hypothetical protein
MRFPVSAYFWFNKTFDSYIIVGSPLVLLICLKVNIRFFVFTVKEKLDLFQISLYMGMQVSI